MSVNNNIEFTFHSTVCKRIWHRHCLPSVVRNPLDDLVPVPTPEQNTSPASCRLLTPKNLAPSQFPMASCNTVSHDLSKNGGRKLTPFPLEKWEFDSNSSIIDNYKSLTQIARRKVVKNKKRLTPIVESISSSEEEPTPFPMASCVLGSNSSTVDSSRSLTQIAYRKDIQNKKCLTPIETISSIKHELTSFPLGSWDLGLNSSSIDSCRSLTQIECRKVVQNKKCLKK